jgi:hypothetical protein
VTGNSITLRWLGADDDYESDFLPLDVFQVDPMFMFADPGVDRLAGDPITGKVEGTRWRADSGRRIPCRQSGLSGRKWIAWMAAERRWPCVHWLDPGFG